MTTLPPQPWGVNPTLRSQLLALYDALKFVLLPLCWPNMDGTCGCGRGHGPKEVGKAPLIPSVRDVESGAVTRDELREQVERLPNANLGVAVARSGLVVVDADSPDAVAEALSLGVAGAAVVGRGQNRHFYFTRPDGVPVARTIHRGAHRSLDMLGAGYIVAPPSRHRSGDQYTWLQPPTHVGLPSAPQWAVDLLRAPLHTASRQSNSFAITPVDLWTLPISPRIARLIQAGPDAEPGRYASRSEALFAVLVALLVAGCTDDQIASIVRDPRHVISAKPLERSEAWLAGEIARARDIDQTPSAPRFWTPRRRTTITIRVQVLP